MKSANILVTGATGLVGSALVHMLLQRGGAKVIASNVSGTARHLEVVQDEVEIVRADIGNFSNVLQMVQTHRPRTIFHIGAMLAPACDADPEAGIRANALGTYHILEAARLFRVEQVIFASSLSVFSTANPDEPVLHDYSLTRPEIVYAAAKLFSENLGLFYKRQHGLDYRGIRLPNILGPAAQTHGFLEYTHKVITEPAAGRPFSVYVTPRTRLPLMYVTDAARAFIELSQAPLAQIKTVNYIIMGPTPAPSAQDLVNAVKNRIAGAKIDFKVNENVQTIIDTVLGKPFDDRYARQEWGWKHELNLEAIVDRFLADMQADKRPSA